MATKWTEADDYFLASHHQLLTIEELAEKLSRATSTITKRLETLKLVAKAPSDTTKPKPTKFSIDKGTVSMTAEQQVEDDIREGKMPSELIDSVNAIRHKAGLPPLLPDGRANKKNEKFLKRHQDCISKIFPDK